MNKKIVTGLVSLASVFTLAACSQNAANNQSSGVAKDEVEGKFKTSVTNEGTAVKGGTFKYALVSASPLKGLFNPILYTDTGDSVVVELGGGGSIFHYGADLKATDKGMASYTIDQEKKTVTVKFKEGLKWSDGQPLTADDYVFTYHRIADKDYTGVRYDNHVANIEGATEYHEGKADKISGIEKVDDTTVVLHLKDVYPALEVGGGAVKSVIIPKHIWENIPTKDMESSEYTREKIVGFGPFIVDKVTSGEGVTFKKNPYYWKGEPKLDGVTLEIVSPDTIVEEMKAGNYDYAEMPRDQYDVYKDLSNVTILGLLENSYRYVAFNLGKWDAEKGEHVDDPSKKMHDPALRKAMALSLDNKQIAEDTLKGLAVEANSLIPPFFKEVYAGTDEVPNFKQDLEGAKKVLADAGYKDTDGDGLVEKPDGSKLQINFLARKGSATNDAIFQQYVTWWREAGLDVVLQDGRLWDATAFSQKVLAYDEDIDVYSAGWTVGYNPAPSGLWGVKAKFNLANYVSEKNTELATKADSNEMFDVAKKKATFLEWQKFAREELFAIPTYYSYSQIAINSRVKSFDIATGTTFDWQEVEVTADAPVAQK